tara:strand:- start:271 stop:456 length:186 start_codon:yes stop_codon:yes gene_type:complete
MYGSECPGCGAYYTIKYEREGGVPRFCPFCGEVYYNIDEEEKDERSDYNDFDEPFDDELYE